MGSDDKKPGGNIETPPVAPGPDVPKDTSLPKIAEKADDLEEIKKAVEVAASVSGGLWLSYLFVLSYVAIAAGAVTHKDLLLESRVKLPFLNVELPLLAFFALAPFVVLITHIYALMHFRMLGNKARHFHKVLRDKYPGEGDNKEIRGNKRRLLPSSIFVQILGRKNFGSARRVLGWIYTLTFTPMALARGNMGCFRRRVCLAQALVRSIFAFQPRSNRVPRNVGLLIGDSVPRSRTLYGSGTERACAEGNGTAQRL